MTSAKAEIQPAGTAEIQPAGRPRLPAGMASRIPCNSRSLRASEASPPPPRASLGGVPQESSCRLAAENMPAHWGEDNFGAKATAEIQSASAFERSLPSCMRASILRMVTDSKHQPLEADVVDTRSAACRQTVFETLPTCCPLESSLRSRM